jgi:hypothetical protein
MTSVWLGIGMLSTGLRRLSFVVSAMMLGGVIGFWPRHRRLWGETLSWLECSPSLLRL